MLVKPKKIRQVYFDHAAATALDKKVLKAMNPYFINEYGNPSALYRLGRNAQQAIEECRKKIAKLINGLPENIIFTSGGTESDNLAILGVANQHQSIGKHIVSIGIEHHAVLHPLEELKKQGWAVDFVKVNKKGMVNAKDIVKAIRPDTVLVTVMYANNEIGSIEPIAEIGRKILQYRKKNKTIYPLFHTDACQAPQYLDLNVEKLHIDLLTLNGSKIYGPKGIGMLYIRRGVKIRPIILGGNQEKKLRAGTENVAGIVGLTKALQLADENKKKNSIDVSKLRNYFWEQLSKKIEKIELNGADFNSGERLPNNLNVIFNGIEGEALLLYLDEYGIMASTGSACTSDSLEASHVLINIGLPYEKAHGSIRFSLGKENKKEDVDYLLKYLPNIVNKLREMSPLK